MDNREHPIPLSALSTLQHTTPEHEGATHTFLIEVPTQLQKERLGLRLYELGVVPISPSTMRATIVNELFELMDEDAADQAADFLHEHWSKQDEHFEAMQRWEQRNTQRILDAAKGAPLREAEEKPEDPLRARDIYRVQGIMDLVNQKSQRYRSMQSRRSSWDQDNARMMLRVAIVACKTIELDREDGVLSADSLERIHKAVGPDGVKSLVRFVNIQYGLEREEIENLGSPSESGESHDGSSEPSGVSGGNDGSSTSTTKKASSITPAPETESETTTDRSSSSTSGKKGRMRKSGQTVEA